MTDKEYKEWFKRQQEAWSKIENLEEKLEDWS